VRHHFIHGTEHGEVDRNITRHYMYSATEHSTAQGNKSGCVTDESVN
jgi:hypothetical protein